MTPFRLAWQTIRGRAGLSALTAGAVAVAGSVIVGATLVGASFRASLYRQIVEPLDGVEHALVVPGLIRADRAVAGTEVAYRLRGTASNAAGTAQGGVTVWGLEAKPEPGEAWISEPLAAALGLKEGDDVFLGLPAPGSDVGLSLFARRDPRENTVELVARVAKIMPASESLARRSLEPDFRPQRTVILDREWMAAQLGRPGRANVVLGPAVPLVKGLDLRDIGLKAVPAKRAGGWVLHADRLSLDSLEIQAAQGKSISVALATQVTGLSGSSGYVSIASVEGVKPQVNAWALQDIGAPVQLDLLVAGPDGGTNTIRKKLPALEVRPMTGIAAEPALMPDLDGVSDASSIDDWDPPFPVDRKLMTTRDEAYWKAYRAAPRLLLPPQIIRSAWEGQDVVTGVWITKSTPEQVAARLIPERLEQWTVRPRERALVAAQGSTDITALLLALGSFILFGALGLAATAFSLLVRDQATTTALLSALGIPRQTILRVFLIQGGLLAGMGALGGLAGGLGFAQAALSLLRSRMPAELGFETVQLHVSLPLLLLGAVGSALVGFAAIGRSAWKASLPAAVVTLRGGRRHRRLDLALGAAALAMLVGGFASSAEVRAVLFGVATLAGGIGIVATLLRPSAPKPELTARDLTRRFLADSAPGVLLGLSLTALATFTLMVVLGRMAPPSVPDSRLLIRTTQPLRIDPSTAEGRRRLGFSPDELQATEGATVTAFLLSPGDDTSCLNPAKSTRPRFLAPLVWARPFPSEPVGAWQEVMVDSDPAPALVDPDTMQWTLGKALGGTIAFGSGEARFVGLLRGTPFAREIVVGEASFRRAFPDVQGPQVFLVDRGSPELWAKALSAVGPEITTVREEVAGFRRVQEAYMSIFVSLGGFGLVIGVVGLVFVGLREAEARRSQLAILSAIGIPRRSILGFALAPGLAASVGIVLGGVAGSVAAGSLNLTALGVVMIVMLLAMAMLRGLGRIALFRGKLTEVLRSE